MKVLRTVITAGVALAGAFPAMAGDRGSDDDVISVIRYQALPYVRDSDGDVISILYTSQTLGGRPVFYAFTDAEKPVYGSGTVAFRGDVEALPQTIAVNDQTYRVEQAGGDVFLYPQGSNRRLQAVRVEASGERVNPTAFTLK